MIARFITQRIKKNTPPTPAIVTAFLHAACEDEKDTVLDGMASTQDRKLGPGGANKIARSELHARWEHERLHLVAGKTLLSRLSAWVQEHYGVAIGAMALTRAFRPNDIPPEVRNIIANIEEGTPFPKQAQKTMGA